MIVELLVEERRAKKLVEEAKETAEGIIRDAQENAEKIRCKSTLKNNVDERTKTETERAKKEAKKLLADYDQRIEEIRRKAKLHIGEAVTLVLKEMLYT